MQDRKPGAPAAFSDIMDDLNPAPEGQSSRITCFPCFFCAYTGTDAHRGSTSMQILLKQRLTPTQPGLPFDLGDLCQPTACSGSYYSTVYYGPGDVSSLAPCASGCLRCDLKPESPGNRQARGLTSATRSAEPRSTLPLCGTQAPDQPRHRPSASRQSRSKSRCVAAVTRYTLAYSDETPDSVVLCSGQ